jgi:hypothetical protein
MNKTPADNANAKNILFCSEPINLLLTVYFL